MSNALIDAAELYLSLGLRVIALSGKAPNVSVHRHGIKDAFPHGEDSRAEGHAAFNHPATTGIGIATSYPYFVVDIDGEEGAKTWLKLVELADYLPDRWVAKTGRGLHLWYASVEPVGNMKLGTLLDLKGEGGYVAAPPSLHPDGHRYEWLCPPDEGPPREAPEVLRQLIHDHNFEAEGRAVTRRQMKRVRHEQFSEGKLWASWGFDALIDGMAKAEPGNRNNYLHWAAATMAEDGASDEEFDQLRTVALANELTALEVKRTIRSARRRG